MSLRFSGIIFATLLGGIGLATLARIDAGRALQDEWTDGKTQAELEAAFDAALPHRERAINFWQGLDYLLFGQPAVGAVAGKDGWLFTDEEYAYAAGADARLKVRVAQIVDVALVLQERDVSLIVALIPDKARIYPEQLKIARPSGTQDRYPYALSLLAGQGISAPNLFSTIAAGKAEGPVFLARDTHWTPYGTSLVARELSKLLANTTLARSSYVATPAEPITHRGDLMNFLDVGAFADVLGLPPEVITRQHITHQAGSLGLFDALPPAQIALVGTSYSADPKWQFADALMLETGAPVLNRADIGRGPFAPMVDFLESGMEAAHDLKVVVWEIPERYMTKLEM